MKRLNFPVARLALARLVPFLLAIAMLTGCSLGGTAERPAPQDIQPALRATVVPTSSTVRHEPTSAAISPQAARPVPPAPAAPAPAAQPKTSILIYFARGEYLAGASRQLPAGGDTEALAEAAMRQLVAGPGAQEKASGLGTLIPAGTRLNAVTLSKGTATVDLSRQFESGGGSLSMLLRVAQVVYTLTEFKEVRNVAFKLDGKPVQAIGGEGIIVAPTVNRADFNGQAPVGTKD